MKLNDIAKALYILPPDKSKRREQMEKRLEALEERAIQEYEEKNRKEEND